MDERLRGQFRLLLLLRFRTLFRGGGRRSRWLPALLALLLLGPLSIGLGLLILDTTRALAAQAPPDALAEWVHLCFVSALLLLLVSTLLGVAGSDFSDLTRLFHLPVRPTTAFLAQVAGQCLAGQPLFLLPALLGVAAGLGGGPAAVAGRAGIALLFLVHGALVAQCAKLLLLHTLRSRRFRDFAVLFAAGASGAAYLGLRLLFAGSDYLPAVRRALDAGISRYLAPLPPLWASGAAAPGAGPGRVLLFALGFVPLTALLVVLGAVLAERAFFAEVPVGKARRAARREGSLRDGPPGLLWVPGPVRALFSREYRLLGREPMLKALLLQQAAFVVVPVFVLLLTGRGGPGAAVPLREWGVYLLLAVEAQVVFNLFGLDGAGAAALLMTPVSRRRLVLGKVLPHLVLWGALNLLVLTGLLLLSSPLPPAEVLALSCRWTASYLAFLGGGVLVSVLAPYPVTARGRRAADQDAAAREGCLRTVFRLAGLGALALLLLPLHAFAVDPARAPLALLAAAALLLVCVEAGGRLLARREDRFVAALLRSRV